MTGLRIACALNALDEAVTARPAAALSLAQQRCAATPQQVWRVLAPLMAARPTMRLSSPETASTPAGFNHVRPLRMRLPDAPAAVPIYVRGRTRLLVFDLDAKHHHPDSVAADTTRILQLLNDSGACAVVDTSSSGGAHVLVPLTRAVSVDEIRPLLELVSARCPTLDKTPMLNAATGCITVAGSACREGGHRVLAATLEAAAAVSLVPNPASVVADLIALVGAGAHPTPHFSSAPLTDPSVFPSGDDDRLAEPFRRTGAPPAEVTAFAATGIMPAPSTRTPDITPAQRSKHGFAHADIKHGLIRGGVGGRVWPALRLADLPPGHGRSAAWVMAGERVRGFTSSR